MTWNSGGYDVAFDPNGTRLVVAERDVIKLLDLQTGAAEELWGHTQTITALGFNHDGTRLVSGDRDTLKIWDTSPKFTWGVEGHEHIAISPDGKHALSAYEGGSIQIRDAYMGQVACELNVNLDDLAGPGLVWSRWHPDDDRLRVFSQTHGVTRRTDRRGINDIECGTRG